MTQTYASPPMNFCQHVLALLRQYDDGGDDKKGMVSIAGFSRALEEAGVVKGSPESEHILRYCEMVGDHSVWYGALDDLERAPAQGPEPSQAPSNAQPKDRAPFSPTAASSRGSDAARPAAGRAARRASMRLFSNAVTTGGEEFWEAIAGRLRQKFQLWDANQMTNQNFIHAVQQMMEGKAHFGPESEFVELVNSHEYTRTLKYHQMLQALRADIANSDNVEMEKNRESYAHALKYKVIAAGGASAHGSLSEKNVTGVALGRRHYHNQDSEDGMSVISWQSNSVAGRGNDRKTSRVGAYPPPIPENQPTWSALPVGTPPEDPVDMVLQDTDGVAQHDAPEDALHGATHDAYEDVPGEERKFSASRAEESRYNNIEVHRSSAPNGRHSERKEPGNPIYHHEIPHQPHTEKDTRAPHDADFWAHGSSAPAAECKNGRFVGHMGAERSPDAPPLYSQRKFGPRDYSGDFAGSPSGLGDNKVFRPVGSRPMDWDAAGHVVSPHDDEMGRRGKMSSPRQVATASDGFARSYVHDDHGVAYGILDPHARVDPQQHDPHSYSPPTTVTRKAQKSPGPRPQSASTGRETPPWDRHIPPHRGIPLIKRPHTANPLAWTCEEENPSGPTRTSSQHAYGVREADPRDQESGAREKAYFESRPVAGVARRGSGESVQEALGYQQMSTNDHRPQSARFVPVDQRSVATSVMDDEIRTRNRIKNRGHGDILGWGSDARNKTPERRSGRHVAEKTRSTALW